MYSKLIKLDKHDLVIVGQLQPHFLNQHYFKSEANSCQLSNIWFICVSQFLRNIMKKNL